MADVGGGAGAEAAVEAEAGVEGVARVAVRVMLTATEHIRTGTRPITPITIASGGTTRRWHEEDLLGRHQPLIYDQNVAHSRQGLSFDILYFSQYAYSNARMHKCVNCDQIAFTRPPIPLENPSRGNKVQVWIALILKEEIVTRN